MIARLLSLVAGATLLAGGCARLSDAPDRPAPALEAAAAALHWAVEDAEGRVLGSASAVAPGRLLTALHLVGERTELRVRQAGADAPVAVHRIRRGERLDAALLEAPAIGATRLADPAGPAAGAAVAAAGMQGGVRRVTAGTAGGAEAARGALHAAVIPVAPGFSGGPVVDAQAQLIGIVVASLVASPEAASRLLAAGGSRDLRLAPQQVLFLPIRAALADPGIAAGLAAPH